MSKQYRIAMDAMGGDNAPGEIVAGAMDAIKNRKDVVIIFVGKKEAIEAELSKYEYESSQVEIVDAREEITFHDAPVEAVRKKKDSSLVVALRLVKEKKADCVISAGNTGAILVGGQFIVGRIRGIERAPLATPLPTTNGVTLLIDCGANVDARPSHLVQFAQMGSIYAEYLFHTKNPRVGIVNIGAEEEKGNALVKETFPLLKECKTINFTGSVEARDIPHGGADVCVCEGFVGNVVLKLTEGLASGILSMIKSAIMANTKSKIGGALIKGSLKTTLRKMDASEYGGAPLLGLNGLVVKVHGSAKRKEVKNAIFQCAEFVENDINKIIRERILNEESVENA